MAIWPWLDKGMKTMAAGKFKDVCLKTLDEVAATRSEIVITKRGRPVARLVPCAPAAQKERSLSGSVLKEQGNPFGTGESWDADPS
jgi:prevent-host-death family protein